MCDEWRPERPAGAQATSRSAPQVPTGPLRDLKDLLHELYLESGAPSLDEITDLVADDDDLVGAPARDTIRRILAEPVLPPAQADVVAVATVLARFRYGRDADGSPSTQWGWEDLVQYRNGSWISG